MRATPRSRWALLVALIAVTAPLDAPAAESVTVPPGYRLDAPIEDVRQPTAIAFAPDGSVFVAERNGRVKVFDGVDDPSADLVLDITAEVHATHDRGLLGMALDPDYPANPYLYLSYPYDAPPGGIAPVHEQGPDGDDNCVLVATGEEDCLASGRVSRFQLDPTTGLAVAGGQTLVAGWCQQVTAHSMGDLKFDPEGALLVSGGDGAVFATPDYGQFGNPCGDPPREGGSLRSQDLGSAADPTGYNGSVIRIDPETGEPWPDNPLIGGADAEARRIVAYGLRNPFRLAIRPGTTELYIGDVGSKYFEEVDFLADPATQPAGPANFGWPCFEGRERTPGFRTLAFDVPLPLCRDLYEGPPANLRRPYFTYPRGDELFDGDDCDDDNGAAISGLTFYEPPAAPLPGAPAELAGSLLIADAVRGCVWEMPAGPGGRPDPAGLRDLVVGEPEDEGAFVPVSLAIGPDGALYLPNFFANEVSRLRRFVGNQPPEAEVVAAPAPYGLMDEDGEFEVTLDASGTADPDDDSGELSYEWDLDGDGDFEVGPSDGPAEPVVYTEEENVTAQVRVTDPGGAADVARIRLYPGDRPPEGVSMDSPAEGLRWTVGEKIALAGAAADPDPGDEARLAWDVILRHCPDNCHSHPLERIADAETAEVTAPDHEYPSHLLIRLSAVDRRGLATIVERPVHPRTVDVRLESVPAGASLTIGTTERPTPFEERLLAGGAATVSAPRTALFAGVRHRFSSWSDGGERTHLVSRTEDDTLVARYVPAVPAPPPLAGLASPSPYVRLRFVSRPRGLPLRVGRRWSRARFGRWIWRGHRPRLAAPRRARARGRTFRFVRWRHTRRRVNRVTAAGPRAYVAVFRRAR